MSVWVSEMIAWYTNTGIKKLIALCLSFHRQLNKWNMKFMPPADLKQALTKPIQKY
jgi:hypothetical protein